MSRLANVQEILRVSAPKLVLFAVIKNAFAASRGGRPFVLEALLDSEGQVVEVHGLR